jgi:hypothetical protein
MLLVVLESLKRKKSSTEKVEFPDSIEIDENFDPENANPSMNATQRGITIESSEDHENALDAIHFSCESDSNEITERDLQESNFPSRESQHNEE